MLDMLFAIQLAMSEPLDQDPGILCEDPHFAFARDGQTVILTGDMPTPAKGYTYNFSLLEAGPAEASVLISAGKPINYRGYGGNDLAVTGNLLVKEKFRVPSTTQVIHIRIEGLTKKPTNFSCVMQAPKQNS